jgi:hypothetical protein
LPALHARDKNIKKYSAINLFSLFDAMLFMPLLKWFFHTPSTISRKSLLMNMTDIYGGRSEKDNSGRLSAMPLLS